MDLKVMMLFFVLQWICQKMINNKKINLMNNKMNKLMIDL